MLTTSTQNQRKDESEKISDKNKEPSRVVIEDSESTRQVLFPNLATMWQPFIQISRTSDRSRKLMKWVKRHTPISWSVRVICKDEVSSISLKRR